VTSPTSSSAHSSAHSSAPSTAPPLPTVAPTLTDGVVTLRAHRAEDVDEIVVQGQDPVMQEWTTVPVPYVRQHAESFALDLMPQGWQTPLGTKGFAIEAMDDGRPRFAGTVDLRPDDSGGAEIGFGLAPWARGRGVMTRAVRLALRWGFEEAGLEVVIWRANVGNWASRRVAWACGFRFEGAVRGLLATRGERRDGWVASLLRGDPIAPGKEWITVPVVVGDEVVLRPWRDDDAPRIVQACSDPVSQRWLPHLPRDYGLEQAEAFLLGTRTRAAEASSLGWCVASATDSRCLGSIEIFGLERDGGDAEIGYWTHPDARGRGVMREALRLAVRHAAVPSADGGLGLHRLGLRAAGTNQASRRLAVGAGFREVGVQRQVDPQDDGTYDDLVVYDVLTAEVTTG
jgi:RimJ/RimL family protein N-acetyltransferase